MKKENRNPNLFSKILSFRIQRKTRNKKSKEIINPKQPSLLSIELRHDLLPIVKKPKKYCFIERIQEMRFKISRDYGINIPEIKIIDNAFLGFSEYSIKINGVEIRKGVIKLKEDDKHAGCIVAEHSAIITTHLSNIIQNHLSELINRQETKALIDFIKKEHPIVVDEVLIGTNGKFFTLGQIKKILQGLLKEQVSIKNMVSIMESIADFIHNSTNIRFHIEMARQALANQICQKYADNNRILHVLTLEESLEQKIIDSKYTDSSGDDLAAMKPALHKAWIKALGNSLRKAKEQGYKPVILCSHQARYLVRNSIDREFPDIAVLSVPEITENYTPKSVGLITLNKVE